MNYPKVVVGLPVYNGQKHLANRLENLLQIAYPNLEILVSDNASTDSTPAICQEYARKYAKIRYIRQERSLGADGNFEYVLKNAGSDYFFFAAHDDLHPSNYVKACLRALRLHPECAACYTKVRFIDEDGRLMILGAKDSENCLSSEATGFQKARYFMLGPTSWLIYGFFSLGRLDSRLLELKNIYSGLNNEYPWVLALLMTGSICGTDQTHFVYRLRPREMKLRDSMPGQQIPQDTGIRHIQRYLEVIHEFSPARSEEKTNRRALLLGALQSYGGCKDWYQMTKHSLSLDLFLSYLKKGEWDLVVFFLLMKLARIKPLRVLCKQKIY